MKRYALLVGLLLAISAVAWGDLIQDQAVGISDPAAGWWFLYFFDGHEFTIERPQIIPERPHAAGPPAAPEFGSDIRSHIVDRQEGVFAWMTPPERPASVEDCVCDLFPGLYAGRYCPKCGRYCPDDPLP